MRFNFSIFLQLTRHGFRFSIFSGHLRDFCQSFDGFDALRL